MTCVFCGGIVAVNTGFVPTMLTATVKYPIAISVRAVRGAGGNRGTAVFTNGLPLTAGCPFLLGRGVCAFPKSVQRHACVCGIFPAGLILRTWHEFIRCPALEGIPRAAGRYRRQRQRDIFGFGLTARRTTAAIGIIRNGVGCRSVFLPNGIESTTDIGVIPLAGLIRRAGAGSTHSPPEKGISVSYRFYRRNQYFYIMSFSLRAGRTAATVCVV